jgi:tetratricopeptide (TPR) repeat protein
MSSSEARLGPFVRSLLIVFATGGASASAQQADVVRCRDGSEVKGRIEAESWRGVEVDVRRGVKRTLGWDEVAAIDWADATAFEKAEDDAKAGRVDEAIAALVPLAKGNRLRGPLRQEVLFTLARLQQRHGKDDDAIAGWRELLASFPDGRYRDDAAEGLVDGLLAKGDPAGASATLDSVVASAKGTESGSHLESVAGALRGRILESQKRFPDARTAYESALRDARLDADLAARARLGAARCLLAEGKKEPARAAFRDLTAREAPNDVLAGAWNGLADFALDDGVVRRDAGTIEVALLSYLRGVVQFKPAEGERSAETERAIAGAAKSFEYLAELSKDPDVKRLNHQRAEMMKRRLAAR